jgi:hypothetical protein
MDDTRTLLDAAARCQEALDGQAAKGAAVETAIAERRAALAAMRREMQAVHLAEAHQRAAVAASYVELLTVRAAVDQSETLLDDDAEFAPFHTALVAAMQAQQELNADMVAGLAAMEAHCREVDAACEPLHAATRVAEAAAAAAKLALSEAQQSEDEALSIAVEVAEQEVALADARAIRNSLHAQLRAATALNDRLLRQTADIRVNQGTTTSAAQRKADMATARLEAKKAESAGLERDVAAARTERDCRVAELQRLQAAIGAAHARLRG